MIKKNNYDICGGDCETCNGFCSKSLSAVTILLRRKVHTKYIPPDMSALKLLAEAENMNVDVLSLSDEELQKLEKQLMDEIFNTNESSLEGELHRI